MIIVGAGPAGRETSGILLRQSDEKIVFFDKKKTNSAIWNDRCTIISEESELLKNLETDPKFCVAIGNPRRREKMFKYLIKLGAKPTNIISKFSYSLSEIPESLGIIIQPGVCISFDVKFGLSNFIHANSVIGHKVQLENFVNISPLCAIVGPCSIGDYTYIGTGSTIYPEIKIGKNVYIAPGSTVKNNLNDYETF